MNAAGVVFLNCCIIIGAAGCGRADQTVFSEGGDRDSSGFSVPFYNRPSPTPPPVTAEEPTETEPVGLLPNQAYSKLTGLPIPAEDILRRPAAVVIDNRSPALPQSGISQAELIYEVLAEGDITRLITIFQSFDAEKIGPVRSAREYFVDFALDYDAFFIHHGGSDSGYIRLKELGIDRMDGMAWEGTYYWRDRTYPSWDMANAGKTRPSEHSSYTSAENIKNAAAAFGFPQTWAEDAAFGFAFNPPGFTNIPNGTLLATEITVPFSANYTRAFTYDPAAQLYNVFNRNGPHVDANTAEGLQVANVLIQNVNTRIIPGDELGHREVQVLGMGTGYLATAGTYQSITWEKDSHTQPTRWYYEDGSAIRLSPGRTWVCVFQQNEQVVFSNGE